MSLFAPQTLASSEAEHFEQREPLLIASMAISFPIDPQQFDSDDRISFSKLDEKFTAVHDDGTEYQFAPELQQWQALSVEGRLSENILDQVNSASDHTSASKRKHTMEHSTEVSTELAAEICSRRTAAFLDSP